MIDINGVSGINPVSYETVSKTQAGSDSGSTFSNVLNDALKDQIMQSAMSGMSGMSGMGAMSSMSGMNGLNGMTGISGMGGIGGTGIIPGVYMPSATAGMENTMLAVAEQGEMSGAHLMLFMLIMMMQTGDSGSELAPIMQMMVQMLSQTTKTDSDDTLLRNNMLDPSNTDPSIRNMVDIALSQVGTRERNADGSFGSGNYTEYGAWYGMDGQPWCAMFVSWSADQAGLLNSVVPRHASCTMGVSAYRDRGLYSPQASNYLPREGDAIYFQHPSSGQIKHVGIVVAYDPQSQRVFTVEGNTSNAVRIRHYSISDPRIHGYGRNGGTSNGIIPGGSTSGSGANTI